MNTSTISPTTKVNTTIYPILFAISFTHLLNDVTQSTIPSLYPIIKTDFQLSFTQIGIITLVFQLTASILQPFIGRYTDKKPKPKSLAIGMTFSLTGLICLAFAPSYGVILVSAGLIGIGSSIFHPEASRVAQLASGGRKGLAQSIFQVGGNTGSAIGPLLVALIVLPNGQNYLIFFAIGCMAGIVILMRVGKWYQEKLIEKAAKATTHPVHHAYTLPRKKIIFSIGILVTLIFSKYFYMASMTSYFTFFLMDKFQLPVKDAQLYLFIFLAAVAIGTILGGSIGDRYGRKLVIWVSILGATPFTLLLPYASLFWTIILAVLVGLIISSAFSAILVYATDLMPDKIGMVAGLFFGFSFGMGGIASALLGVLADHTSIEYVFRICAFLPLIGIVTGFLPRHRVSQQVQG